MKIAFEDGSFISVEPNDESKLSVTLCGLKSNRELTMSTSNLTVEQVVEIIKFMVEWVEKETQG